MKKITIAIIALLGLYSCTEDFITKDPLGVSSSASYYKDPDQCQLAVNAIYDPLGWFQFHDEFLWKIGDICSDDCERGGANSKELYTTGDDWDKSGQLCVFEANDRSSVMSGIWKAGYIAIGRANAMLAGSKGVDNADIKTMRAEVRFLRAWYYFQLTKVFGPVILTKETVSVASAEDLGNRAENDVDGSKQVRAQYDFIIDELKGIIDELPVKANAFGKVTKGAAQAFLAKAYLYRADFCNNPSDYQNAYDMATTIINDGNYALEGRYQDLFDIYGDSHEQSSEVIFSVQFVHGTGYGRDGGEGSIQPLYVAPRYFWDPKTKAAQIEDGLGYGFAMPTQNLLDEFEAGDPRATLIVASSHGNSTIDATITKLNLDTAAWIKPTKTGDNSEGWYAIGKVDWNTGYYNLKKSSVSPLIQNGPNKDASNQCAGKDNIVLRYGDVLLIAAEAAVHLSKNAEAAGYLNQLRHRANNSARTLDYTKNGMTDGCYTYTPSTALPDLGTAELADVKHERRVEMYGEAERYWDLVRWGDTKKFRTEDISGYKFQYNEATLGRWPIPQDQIILHTGGNLKQNPGY